MNLKILLITLLVLPVVAVADETKYTVYVEAAFLYEKPALPGEENTSNPLTEKLSKGAEVIEETKKIFYTTEKVFYTENKCKKLPFSGQANQQVYDWIYTRDWACVKTSTGMIGWIHRMFIRK